jgi:hypothetical protein
MYCPGQSDVSSVKCPVIQMTGQSIVLVSQLTAPPLDLRRRKIRAIVECECIEALFRAEHVERQLHGHVGDHGDQVNAVHVVAVLAGIAGRYYLAGRSRIVLRWA